MLAVVATYSIDPELVIDRVDRVIPGREPRVLGSMFEQSTHARAVVRAANALTDYCLKQRSPMRVVLPDRTAVDLLRGDGLTKEGRLGQMITSIRHKVEVQGALVIFEYGTLRTTLGEAAEHIDLW